MGVNSSTDELRPLSQIAYDSLKTIMFSGAIRPGERLSERDLARRIHVSRTPLREALNRLERDGLAVNKPGRGYFAPEFDPTRVAMLYEFREILETSACRLAAERISRAGIAELHGVMRQLARFESMRDLTADQVRTEVELGISLHEIIARESGNELIREALLQIYGQLRLLTWIDVLLYDQWAITRQEHRDLVNAVTSRDRIAAVKVTTRHIQRCRDGALRVVKAQYKETEDGSQNSDFPPARRARK